jgi:hypothetical protein
LLSWTVLHESGDVFPAVPGVGADQAIHHGSRLCSVANSHVNSRPLEILGHSGIAGTMNTYAHVLPMLLAGAADGMDDVLG